MSDESIPSSSNEGAPPSKTWKLWSPRYGIPVACFVLFASVGAVFLFQFPYVQDISTLKNQTAALAHRVDQLEASEKIPLSPGVSPEQIKDIEARITALSQQIEAVQNQPKVEASSQPSAHTLAVEREVARLSHVQKT